MMKKIIQTIFVVIAFLVIPNASFADYYTSCGGMWCGGGWCQFQVSYPDPVDGVCSLTPLTDPNFNNELYSNCNSYGCVGGALPPTTAVNTAPGVPVISGPISTTVNTTQTYSFVATDSQNDQIRYGVDWNTDGTVDYWSPYVNSGTLQSTTYSWTTSGAKTFRVLAQDAHGLNSSWGAYSVTVVSPTGTVAVSSSPSSSWEINGPNSSILTGSGTSQTYTSQPTGAYTIAWGDVAGYIKPPTQSRSLAPGDTISFSGSYTLNSYTVSATAGAGGNISPASQTINHGSITIFTITPNAGYTASASGCGGSLSGTTYTTGAITGACTVSATYSINSYTVSVTAGAGGTISPASRVVSYGGTTTFTVTPNAGYTASASGCGGSLSGTTYTTGAITGACTVSATYSINSYTVSVTAGAGGTISPASRVVSSGSTTTFTITPNAGYTASASGCAGSLSGTTYTTGAITGACTVSATYTLIDVFPTPPIISGPTTLITGYSGTHSFVSTDPQGEQISYAVDWNSDGTDLWMPYGSVPPPGGMTYVNSGVSQSASKSWATPGTYTVRVLAQNKISGNNSAWTTYTITVSDPQPCTAGVVDSSGSWAPTCSTSATCLTPPDPAQLTNQPGIQIGICPTPEYTGNAYRSCSTATITCTQATSCGDGTCNGSETLLTCPADCKARYQQF